MPGRAASPPVSQAQRRAFYAAAEGHSHLGIPRSVGAEKVRAGHGLTGLPMRVQPAMTKEIGKRLLARKGG